MAELVDALASGASVRKYVEVQVLLSAPKTNFSGNLSAFALVFFIYSLSLSSKIQKIGLFSSVKDQVFNTTDIFLGR